MLVIHFDAHTFLYYTWPLTGLRDGAIRAGLLTTIYIAVASQLLGMALGFFVALGRTCRVKVLRSVCLGYVTYIRGTPLLVQITLVYFGCAELGITNFGDVHIAGIVIPGVSQAGVIALAINKGAYVAEIMRAALNSIGVHQWEAAQALGMRRRKTLYRIILPQVARVATPALGNEFNAALKDTSLLVVVGGVELFHAFQELNGKLFLPLELYLAMSFYFLVLTAAWGRIQRLIERRFARGFTRTTYSAPRLGRSLWRTS